MSEDLIDQATARLREAVNQIRADTHPDVKELVVRTAVFRLAVQILDGREGLAEAAQVCGETKR